MDHLVGIFWMRGSIVNVMVKKYKSIYGFLYAKLVVNKGERS